MGLIPREAQNNINSAIKLLRSIDISLGRIAQALEDQNEHYLREELKEVIFNENELG